MAVFEFRNAQEIGRVSKDHCVKYLFFGKSGAILLGYSDTTQDVNLYVEKEAANCRKLAAALLEIGFRLTEKSSGSGGLSGMVYQYGVPIANIDDIVGSRQEH